MAMFRVTLLVCVSLFVCTPLQAQSYDNDVAYGTCMNFAMDAALLADTAIPAHQVSYTAAIPLNILWNFFSKTQYLELWNPSVVNATRDDVPICGQFPFDVTIAKYVIDDCSNPPFNVTAFSHVIVQKALSEDGTAAALAWQFNITDTSNVTNIVTGRHTFYLEETTDNRTVVQHWEKAMGPQLGWTSSCPLGWNLSLQISALDTLTGVACLERVYFLTGGLNAKDVQQTCDPFTPNIAKQK